VVYNGEDPDAPETDIVWTTEEAHDAVRQAQRLHAVVYRYAVTDAGDLRNETLVYRGT
jgi:hypothetical protein